MQGKVPELLDIAREPQSVLDEYGPDVRKPGSFAANCLLARRLAERSGRSVETIRAALRQHDVENPAAAIFPVLGGPVKQLIGLGRP